MPIQTGERGPTAGTDAPPRTEAGQPATPGPRVSPDALPAGHGPDLRHSALGHELGGAYQTHADPAATRAAVRSLLETPDLLPPGAVVDAATSTVRMHAGGRAYEIRFETAPVRPEDLIVAEGHRYAPTAAVQFGPDGGVVHLSENASPTHVRQAAAAVLAEVQARVEHAEAGTRLNGTSLLYAGGIPTESQPRSQPTDPLKLSAPDIGRAAAMRVLAHDLRLAGEAGDPARVTQLRADAAGMATRYGLADPEPAKAPFKYQDRGPTVGAEAVGERQAALRDHLGADEYAEVQPVVTGRDATGRDWGDQLDALRVADREHLAAGVRDLMDTRDHADVALTHRIDAARVDGTAPVLGRIIIGDGWAATQDYVNLRVPGDNGTGIPHVLCIGTRGEPWITRELLEMGQLPAELELPGMPLQPSDFTRDGTGFARSQDFGLAVGAGRALSGMPTYHAEAVRVEALPSEHAPGWPEGAKYRLHFADGRPPLYAEAVDIAAGPGPARIPRTGDEVPPRVVDPGTGYAAEHTGRSATFTDREGAVVAGSALPAEVRQLFGLDDEGNVLFADDETKRIGPQFTDRDGRLTDPRVVDGETLMSVDPDTRTVYDSSGLPVEQHTVPTDVLRRLGFSEHGFLDQRYVHDAASGYSMHTLTGDVVRTADLEPRSEGDPTGTDQPHRAASPPADPPPHVREALEREVRSRRVQFGAENVPDSYGVRDRVLVYGAGPSGAWDIVHAVGREVKPDWVARPEPGLDPFGGGRLRRTTADEIGAFSADVQSKLISRVETLVAVQSTAHGEFVCHFRDADGAPSVRVYDRVVLSVGLDSTAPGGVESLVRGHTLQPIYGPGSSVDGLRDSSGGLRVVGAAGAVGRVGQPGVLNHVPEPMRPTVAQVTHEEGQQLPLDSRGITPAIRNHALRIADMNSPFSAFHADLTHGDRLSEHTATAENLVRNGYAVRGLDLAGQPGLGLIREGDSDAGRVGVFRDAASTDPELLALELQRNVLNVGDAGRAVVIDGRSVGLTESAAREAYARGGRDVARQGRVLFVLADGSVIPLGGGR